MKNSKEMKDQVRYDYSLINALNLEPLCPRQPVGSGTAQGDKRPGADISGFYTEKDPDLTKGEPASIPVKPTSSILISGVRTR